MENGTIEARCQPDQSLASMAESSSMTETRPRKIPLASLDAKNETDACLAALENINSLCWTSIRGINQNLDDFTIKLKSTTGA